MKSHGWVSSAVYLVHIVQDGKYHIIGKTVTKLVPYKPFGHYSASMGREQGKNE